MQRRFQQMQRYRATLPRQFLSSVGLQSACIEVARGRKGLSGGCAGQIFGRVEVLKKIRRESRGLQLFFRNGLGSGWLKQHIDFVAALAQGLLSNIGKLAAVDGAEGLPSASGLGRSDDGGGDVASALDDVLEQRRGEEWQVDGEDEVEVDLGSAKSRVNSAKRAAVAEDVRNGGGEFLEGGGIADDADIGCDGTGGVEGAGEQRLSAELNERLVGTHACAFAAGENKDDEIGNRGHRWE